MSQMLGQEKILAEYWIGAGGDHNSVTEKSNDCKRCRPIGNRIIYRRKYEEVQDQR